MSDIDVLDDPCGFGSAARISRVRWLETDRPPIGTRILHLLPVSASEVARATARLHDKSRGPAGAVTVLRVARHKHTAFAAPARDIERKPVQSCRGDRPSQEV